jgi:hypothetical protein
MDQPNPMEANTAVCVRTLEEMGRRLNELRGDVNKATDGQMFSLLQDISMSGVELDDPHLPYVTVQIDRHTWQRLQGYKPGEPECDDAYECFECGSPIVNNTCAYCESEEKVEQEKRRKSCE